MSESILSIQDAECEGARVVIAFCGISGSGKTYTALQFAYGLAGYDARKVGFLDSENRRGRLYANTLKNDKGEVQRFRIADLRAPFSPARYKQAILEFQAAGVKVLVIDSTSHEWEGTGGCHDIANTGGRVKKWNLAKDEHKSFMNVLLQCDMDIVVCVRAREKVEMVTVNGKVEYNKLGVLPIQEPNFMFEMTASMMMWEEGKAQKVLKCPGHWRHVMGRETDYITAADGKAVRDWLDGAKQIDPEVERARNMLWTTTENGMLALQAAWVGLPSAMRRAISGDGKCPADLKSSAEAFDKQRLAAIAGDDDLDDINQQIAGSDNHGAEGEQAAA